ncbi:oligopeptidase B [Luteitalea sp. TBR-22]|uniref:S9 family peptidase n=1 Tax=Luteitalea sp. TBR-22 TaxID=2802971 RepID=UPI001AF06A93|nr:S9 family peptidase [Luteitalea sp. TBR-22]BCS32772.1 oligopeptidase B [Luteitalea sp. TBR-22]
MEPRLSLLVSAALVAATAPLMAQTPTPPVAAQKPHTVASPNGDRVDPYYWLRDDTRKSPELLKHLEAENAYTEAVMAPVKALRAQLFEELKGRYKQDDEQPAWRMRGFLYSSRFVAGKDYAVNVRRPVAGGAEQVLVDQNALAEGHQYFSLGQWDVSLDNARLAYSTDTVGRRQYVIQFKDIATGALLPEKITGTSGNVAWAADNKTVFYVEIDPKTLLSKRVKRHVVGTDPSTDVLVYEEPDDSFYMGVSRTKDDRFLCIGVSSTVSSEARCIPADQPTAAFRVLVPRERDFEYDADHVGTHWIIRTNYKAKNFRVVEATDAAIGQRDQWKDLVPHRDDVFVSGVEPFDRYVVVGERRDGLQRLRILDAAGASRDVASDEPAYVMGLGVNREANTTVLRYSYTSLTTPSTIYDLDMTTGARTLVKETPVLGGFDKARYATERIWVPARDGVKVPVSIVYRKETPRDGSAPLYLYAYGSYGISSDPAFRTDWLSLLDRGFVMAIAHIRGGQELGRHWYEDGKLLKKKNTFTDFVDVTEALVARKYAAADKVFAMGGSAGGLLMGAVANLAPERYRGIVSHVPFVDVVTTMLDESIPLTTNEFDEWGNPKKKEFYDYMLSYSPYDQLQKKAYPAMLVTTGLWDSQVQYWEPAKYVAKLRTLDTSSSPVLFRVNMEAGHGGRSGRFTRLEQVALEYAFILQQLGKR